MLLYYCYAASVIAFTRIAVAMETAALGALEYIPRSPPEFSIPMREMNGVNGIPQIEGRGETAEELDLVLMIEPILIYFNY